MPDRTKSTLDRRQTLETLFPHPDEYLFITGLAGAARDVAALTDDGPNVFTMAGAMGAAVSMGLGLALSDPAARVAVVTGDGELLMNVGSLATVATMGPENLAIVCMDNAAHGETGSQTGHTAHGTDLEMMAKGAGIAATLTVDDAAGLASGAAFLAEGVGPKFLCLRVAMGPPAAYKRNMNPSECRLRFRQAHGGAA